MLQLALNPHEFRLNPNFKPLNMDEISSLIQSIITTQSGWNFSIRSKHHHDSKWLKSPSKSEQSITATFLHELTIEDNWISTKGGWMFHYEWLNSPLRTTIIPKHAPRSLQILYKSVAKFSLNLNFNMTL